ncbi:MULTISPECIES: polysaccharide pyruvyl transferase family protein [unclassified Brevibacterium]|uniref:polysaccharide pyruvyl transferase family protein n=1 Tax=unclassified Brevibacterium TaxID=2614124 RepID=UPI001E2A6254|nr:MULTISPECIES: polysaccharide pyruvyl transferase family protein [unclassified Brevibacterium]MDK8434592.1 polysaccharide pyruvyl transferase family protein [Brevibacterium sp. H-BE7]
MAENVGNLLFSQSVYRSLATPDAEITPDGYQSHRRGHSADFAAQINADYDAFVIPLANAFRPGFQKYLQRLTELVSKLRIPVVVVGVGSQHKLDVEAEGTDPIAADVSAFMNAVLERSSSVGVRGEYTAEYLAGLGYDDSVVDIIGCPSIFMNGPNPQVGRPTVELQTDSAVAMNVSPYVRAMKPIVARHSRKYENLVYIPQNHNDLAMMVWGINRTNPKDLRNPTHTGHELYRRDQMRFPLDPRTWVEFLSKQDFVFGTRIHGSIAGILSGTPTFLLAHDSRTLELGEYHRLPHAKISSLPKNIDAAELHERTDFTEFEAQTPEVLSRYIAFLEKNGLSHTFASGNEPVEFDRMVAEAKLPDMVPTLFADGDAGKQVIMERIRDLHERQSLLESTLASNGMSVDGGGPVQRGRSDGGVKGIFNDSSRRVRRIVSTALRRAK